MGEKRCPRPGTRVRSSKQNHAQPQWATETELENIRKNIKEKEENQKADAEGSAPLEEEVEESWDANLSSSDIEEGKSSTATALTPTPVVTTLTVPPAKDYEGGEARKAQDAEKKPEKVLERIQVGFI